MKAKLLSSIGTFHPQKSSQSLTTEGHNFSDFIKDDMKGFLNKANDVNKMMTNYAMGVGDIEQIAPMLKELMLEFEVKTKIVSSLANVLKTLTSMNI